MNFYNTKFKSNKNQNKLFNHKSKLNSKVFTSSILSVLLFLSLLTIFSPPVFAEPSMDSLLTDLGYTNTALSSIETFPAGLYQVSLLAEFGEFREINSLRYYPVGTQEHQTIFTGPEGVSGNGEGSYVVPPVSKSFEVNSEFGLSINAPSTYYSETWKNEDGEQHAKVFTNLDSSNMYLVLFEDTWGGTDRDFNDMVISIKQIVPPTLVSVTQTPETPNAYEGVKITSTVASGSYDIQSVTLTYQVGSSSWTSLAMNPELNTYVTQIPGQTFGTQIRYKVSVSDTQGYTDSSLTRSYTIAVPEKHVPIANFTQSPTEAFTGEDVEFDASSTYDVDGTIETYSWDFGDGTNATGVIVNHSYEENGEYAVTLTAIDNHDLAGSIVKQQLIKNRPPTAAFTESTSNIYPGESIAFDASTSSDPDGTIVSYTWSFGDERAATGQTINHRYTDPGFYTVILTVNDDDGATDDQKRSIRVSEVETNPANETETNPSNETQTEPNVNELPIAIILNSLDNASSGETVHFDASQSYDSDGTIVEYSWDFGDGTVTTGAFVDHTYTKDGVYTITLTVKDDSDAYSSITEQITVETAETEPSTSLSLLSSVGLGITSLTAILLFSYFVRRKKNKKR